MDMKLRMMSKTGSRETAQAAYDGARYYRTDSGVYLKDFGHGESDDSAKLYGGQMLSFDSVDDYVDCGVVPDVVQNNILTSIFTFKSSFASRQTIVSHRYKVYEISIDYDGSASTAIEVWFGDNANYTRITLTYTGNLTDGNIHRLAVVLNRSSGVASAYVDGVLVDSTSGAGWTAPSSTSYKLMLGFREGGTNNFDGFLGNIQIWNAAFDADDVEYDYLNCYQNLTADNRPGTSLTSANLKGHWPLIAGSGDVAHDWSGNGNHGTLTNFPTDDSQWSNASALDSPLAIQTVLCEWGRGSNLLIGNRDLNNGTYWSKYACTITETSDYFIQKLNASKTNGYFASMSMIAATQGDVIDFSIFVEDIDASAAGGKYTIRYRELDSSDVALKTDYVVNAADIPSSFGVINGSITVSEATTAKVKVYYRLEGAELTSVKVKYPQIEKAVTTRTATVFTVANEATNALVPIRSWETAGQFKRDYSELNWNGRSYANCGNGADVNPSTALIVECVINMDIPASTQFIVARKGFSLYVQSNGNFALNVVTPSDDHYTILSNGIDGATHHFVCVFSASLQLIRMYKNSVKVKDEAMLSTDNITATANDLALCSVSTTSPNLYILGQLPLFKMWGDEEAQAIIDGDLDAWVAKQYNKAKAKYNL